MDIKHETSWIRVVNHGNGYDGYKDVEILVDGQWILSKRFEESSDLMYSDIRNYLDYLRLMHG